EDGPGRETSAAALPILPARRSGYASSLAAPSRSFSHGPKRPELQPPPLRYESQWAATQFAVALLSARGLGDWDPRAYAGIHGTGRNGADAHRAEERLGDVLGRSKP